MPKLLRNIVGPGLLSTVIGFAHVCAQDTANGPTLQQAAELFKNKEWAKAVVAYDAITTREPQNGLAWLRLGLAYHGAEQHKKALPAFAKADDFGFAQGISRFNLARCHIQLGHTEEALDWLDKAMKAGYSNAQQLQQEAAFASLTGDQRFAALITMADKNARPCEFDEKHRELDFWIGEWDVYSPQGQRVGGNKIHKIQTGCAIQENWTSQGGGTGMSINYFEPETQQWKQTWVSANGTIILLYGEFKDGAMHFTSGKNIGLNGKSEQSRMTLTPMADGSVIQFIEQSRDEGKTWYVWFKGKYVRTPASSGT